MSRFASFVRIASLVFVVASIASFALHFVLWMLPLGDTLAVADLLSMSVTYWLDFYHVSYFLVTSFVFALLSAIWLVVIAPRFQKLEWLQIASIPLLALLFAGLLCSVIWEVRSHWMFHDIHPVPFPNLGQLLARIWSGAKRGLVLSPSAALLSFPWNALWYGISCSVIVFAKRWRSSV